MFHIVIKDHTIYLWLMSMLSAIEAFNLQHNGIHFTKKMIKSYNPLLFL